ncbi:tetratricopeptide repeat protein 38-like [Amphiura filiformis]|uniref:tetratricopeptide repeat protein 38-like n=1 Tax=Amphiura filiformis TaxID=82378 RepID=UPI003B2278C3
MTSHWRDCAEWQRQGLKLSTTSNQAAKIYDAVLSQRVSMYDDPSVGGMEQSLKTLQAADPQFVMGQVMSVGMSLFSTSDTIDNNPELRDKVNALVVHADKSDITPREQKHVDAINLYADGKLHEATVKWEEIVAEYPTDLHAIKQVHGSTFVVGRPQIIRNVVNSALPSWTTDMKHYSFLKGILAFGFAETSLFPQANKTAKEGLAVDQDEVWCRHSLCHLHDNTGQWDYGIDALQTTEAHWMKCTSFNCHLLWHQALFYMEKADYDKVLEIYDNHIEKTLKDSHSMLAKRDATSLLYRLEMEGVKIGDRWEDVYEICRPNIDDHCFVFNDTHMLMSCLGAKKPDVAKKMVNSLRNWARDKSGYYYQTCMKTGLPICEAFVAAADGDFATAVDLIHPVRYDIINIGGSNAQRDVFNLFLINAAINSSKPEHQHLAKSLIHERRALKEDTPLTDRLMSRLMAQHTQ